VSAAIPTAPSNAAPPASDVQAFNPTISKNTPNAPRINPCRPLLSLRMFAGWL
jgi:hypothetical protein